MKLLKLFTKDENGGGLIEYTLIVALIALAVVTAIMTLQGKMSDNLTSVSNKRFCYLHRHRSREWWLPW